MGSGRYGRIRGDNFSPARRMNSQQSAMLRLHGSASEKHMGFHNSATAAVLNFPCDKSGPGGAAHETAEGPPCAPSKSSAPRSAELA